MSASSSLSSSAWLRISFNTALTIIGVISSFKILSSIDRESRASEGFRNKNAHKNKAIPRTLVEVITHLQEKVKSFMKTFHVTKEYKEYFFSKFFEILNKIYHVRLFQ